MSKIKLAVVGYGNIGKYAVAAALSAPDIDLLCVVRRKAGEVNISEVPVVTDITSVNKPDVAVLAVPSRNVPAEAEKYLRLGINTVDSFDIHSDIYRLKSTLAPISENNNAVSVIAAGWDPGLDSVMRALFLLSAPKGITYTDFGPGMSMGHSVAVNAIPGVKNALSVTLPKGSGLHRRMVYVETLPGADFNEITKQVKLDPYFANDETHVIHTNEVEKLKDAGHGVTIRRKGVSGVTDNQLFEFDMRINNPALTAQILISTARAASRLAPGCYTMLEIPPVYYLPGSTEEHIKALV